MKKEPVIKSTLSYGNLKLHHIRNNRFKFNQDRIVRVLLPEDYDPNGEKYEVIYMLDGQNLFDRKTAQYHMEWCMDEIVKDKMQTEGIRPRIIVGLDCGDDRIPEYLPLIVSNEELQKQKCKESYEKRQANFKEDFDLFKAKGDITFDYLINDVMPFVEENYNVRTDREGRTFGGSSMGGLMAVYAYEHYYDIFKNYIAFSIAFPILKNITGKDEIFKDFCSKFEVHKENRIAICVGGKEFEAEFTPYYNEFTKLLRELGLDDTNLFTVFDPKAFHNEYQWCKAMQLAYVWFFKK